MLLLQTEIDPQIAAEYATALAEKGLSFMGVSLFDPTMLLTLILRFAANLLVCWIITRYFYYKKSVRKDYYFTFMLFSVTVFLLLFVLQNLSMGTGFALGLFCIFGMIRYRTESIQIREMTYLFVVIGVSAINGLSMDVDYTTLFLANALVLFIIWALEKSIKQTSTKIVLYEKIALIVPERHAELKADLEKRIGIKVLKFEIGHVDFLRDVAFIKVYYQMPKNETNTIDSITKINEFV